MEQGGQGSHAARGGGGETARARGGTTAPTESCLACSFYVYSSGKKVYRLLARIHGKQVALTVGDASLMTLAEARAKAKGFLAAIAKGEDPREAKRAAVRAAAETVEAVARSFIERHTKVHTQPRSRRETERLFEHDILPAWGRRPIASIDLRDVNALLDAIVDRGSPVVANRVLAAGAQDVQLGAERGLIKTSPFEHVKAPAKETSRDRTPSDSELALILRAADSLGYPFGPYFKLLAFTGQRREEVAGMRWSELDEDLTLWVLPRSRAKNDVEHQVPIAPAVREILVALPRFDGSDLRVHDHRRDADLWLLQGQEHARRRHYGIERRRPDRAVAAARSKARDGERHGQDGRTAAGGREAPQSRLWPLRRRRRRLSAARFRRREAAGLGSLGAASARARRARKSDRATQRLR